MFAAIKANKDSRRDVLSAEDFKNDKENYMNIISKISPAVLAYIDNMKFNYSQAVTAVLLQLKMKDAIKYDKHKLIKLREIDEIKEPEFGEIERYIFGCIKDGQVYASKKDLEYMVINEARKQNLLEMNLNEKLSDRMIKMFFILLISFVISNICVRLDIFFEFGYFLGLATRVLAIAFFIYVFMYEPSKYVRTEYGVDINKKIEGLKNYIKEYSLLHEKDSDALKIWDDYYIYYAIFERKQIVITDHIKYIRIK